MTVVLDAPRADVLARAVIARCDSGRLVATVITRTGGQQIAQQSTTGVGQMARFALVRELNIIAVQGRTDVTQLPTDWVLSQLAAVAPSPELVGAALRIYTKTGTPGSPNFQLVGVVGLLGVDSEFAVKILTEVLRDNGLHVSSDLP